MSERRRIWLALFGAFTVLALVSASRMYFGIGRISAFDALGSALIDWYLWLPLCQPILWLARRAPLGRRWLLRTLTLHVASGVVFSLLQIVAYAASSAWIREWRFGEGSLRFELRSGFAFKFHTGVIVYWAVLLAARAWEYHRRSRAEAVRRAELDRALSRAQLQLLQAQLRPHFLFNTLNTIAASIRSDPDGAERMLATLGDLLRATLQHRDDRALSLREELEFLEGYVNIQRARFGERLTVRMEVEPEVLETRLPCFLLQPLVENAIRHGVATRTGWGFVRLAAARRADRVEVVVEDDGPGPPADLGRRGGGLGLTNTRERLSLYYGDDFTLRVAARAEGGTAVRLSIPRNGTGDETAEEQP